MDKETRYESAQDMVTLASERVQAIMEIYHDTDPSDWLDFVTDVLTDLRHFCDEQGMDFDKRAERSEEYFNTERSQAK